MTPHGERNGGGHCGEISCNPGLSQPFPAREMGSIWSAETSSSSPGGEDWAEEDGEDCEDCEDVWISPPEKSLGVALGSGTYSASLAWISS